MTTTPFLITGLPRSRTAWMAALCNTQPNAVCFHEPARDHKTWRDSLNVWKSCGYAYIGISDHGLGFNLHEILSDYRPNVLIIQRDPAEVEASLRALGLCASTFLRVLSSRLAGCLRNSSVMQVGFSELRDPRIVADCLEWLMPGNTLDRTKIELMCRMNVQAELQGVLDLVKGATLGDLIGAEAAKEIAA